jgi:orotate phosphoribosyltransferase
LQAAISAGLAEAAPSRDHDGVETQVSRLARPRQGHFDLGTGYHGDVWLDLDALFLRPALLRPHIRWLADRLREHHLDAVCGPAEGGAFLAQSLADILETAFLPAYRAPVSAAGYRLPGVRGGISGWRVAIADDAVNAGTAIRACSGQLRDHGAVLTAVAALMSLGRSGSDIPAALAVPFYASDTLASQAWPAGSCPLCASGIPLKDPASQD